MSNYKFFATVSVLFSPFVTSVVFAENNDAPVSFSRDILPILSNKCFVCHGPDTHDEDMLRLDSYEAASADRGGYRAIDSEHPEKSAILERIHSIDDPMPPEDAEKQLSDSDREKIDQWIKQGGKYAKHWAFELPKKTAAADHSEDNIDAYIEAELNRKGVNFSPEADRRTLARRVALILTGLPPEPDQLEEFIADESSDAYEEYVDRLLASPRYGEHQARYWLDAVRYGDTHGLHLDNRRGIYPYRDWVVNAFNRNLPFDDFLTWQIAGDLLPNPTLEQQVATGFVRMNPSTSEGGALPEEFQAKNNFDRTEAFGTVLLGMSMTCARCHTHKYDPIPQTEYYRLLAFFNSTAEPAMDGNSYTYGPTVKAPQNQVAWTAWYGFESRQTELLAAAQSKIDTSNDLSDEELKEWKEADSRGRLAFISKTDSFGELTKQASTLHAEMKSAEEKFTTTLVAKELEKPRTTHVLRRGEYNLPVGDPLEPGILTVMSQFPEDAPRNRIGLARWITSRNHPLVARVLINRVWQRTFGYGLVRTPEDFGLQGEQPTHPRLLDWLAVEFQESGWNLKHMIRLMVTSRTFRQSSAWRSDVDDPQNRLFARGPAHRLDAEVLRDIGLWASELLDPQMGGEGVKPYQPSGMWLAMAHPASNTKKYVRDKGELLYRRSIYVYWKRTSPHPMMTLFDAPDRESSCVGRSRTNTSLQSLGLLNETQRIEMSRKLAERLMRERSETGERLNLLYTLIASRNPNERERAACESLLQSMQKRFTDSTEDALRLLSTGDASRDKSLNPAELAAWTQVSAIALASDAAILLY